MKSSQRIRLRARDVAEFRDAYLEFMETMGIGARPGTMTMSQMHPKPGREADAAQRFPRVSRAAGKAEIAAGEHARLISITQFGQRTTFDPIANWQQSIDNPEQLPSNMVVNCCEGIIGALEAKADEAAAVEGTLVGRIAAFVGFPARVRAAVAVEHPGMAKAAFGVGVAGQLAIGILVTVLGAGAVAGIVALWNVVF